MDSSSIEILEDIPIFSLAMPKMQGPKLETCFKGWPSNCKDLLLRAQEARTLCIKDCNENQTIPVRLDHLEAYLLVAVDIEAFLREHTEVKGSEAFKMSWEQAPIVIPERIKRNFLADKFSLEVLHIVFYKAVLKLNLASILYAENDIEAAIRELRETAGIFSFLSQDHYRITGAKDILPEFNPNLLSSLTTFCLAQVYAIIARKAMIQMRPNTALYKLCFTVSQTYETALRNVKLVQEHYYPSQYINWLDTCSKFYESCAAAFMGFHCLESEKRGQAVGFMMHAANMMCPLPEVDAKNKQINVPATKLHREFQDRTNQWREKNSIIYGESVPDGEKCKHTLSVECMTPLNFPQPIPYQPPLPGSGMTAASMQPFEVTDPISGAKRIYKP